MFWVGFVLGGIIAYLLRKPIESIIDHFFESLRG